MKNRKGIRITAVVLCMAVAAGVCAACSSQSASNTAESKKTVSMKAGITSAAGMADAAVAQETVRGTSSGAENTTSGGTGTSSASAVQAAASGQKIIERLSYQIETLQFDDSVKKLQSLCTTLGGYVQDSNVAGSGIQQQNLRSATYVLRIPQGKLAEFKNSAGSIGSILNLTSSSENVSEKYFDTQARLKSLRTQQERLLALMKKSGSLTDVIALEKALADVNYQIEQLTGTLRQYDSLIDYSTVSAQIDEVVKPTELEKTPVTVGEKIAKQFKGSLRALSGFGEGLLVFLIGGSPILLPLAVIAVLAISFMRRKRKREQKKAEELMGPLVTIEKEPEEKQEDHMGKQ